MKRIKAYSDSELMIRYYVRYIMFQDICQEIFMNAVIMIN